MLFCNIQSYILFLLWYFSFLSSTFPFSCNFLYKFTWNKEEEEEPSIVISPGFALKWFREISARSYNHPILYPFQEWYSKHWATNVAHMLGRVVAVPCCAKQFPLLFAFVGLQYSGGGLDNSYLPTGVNIFQYLASGKDHANSTGYVTT